MHLKLLDTIVILNHVKREREGLALKKLLEVQTDPLGIRVEISLNDGSTGIWPNYQNALRIPSRIPELWRLIVHDDIYFNRGFIEKILYVLKYAPDEWISFYTPNNQGYKKAKAAGHSVLRTQTNFWSQCLATPTSAAEDFIRWCGREVDEDYPWEDSRIKLYCKANGRYVCAVLPGLAQHFGAYRSLLGIGGKVGKLIRVSGLFQPEFDVTKVDWDEEFSDPFCHESNTKDLEQMALQNEAKRYYKF